MVLVSLRPKPNTGSVLERPELPQRSSWLKQTNSSFFAPGLKLGPCMLLLFFSYLWLVIAYAFFRADIYKFHLIIANFLLTLRLTLCLIFK